MTQKPRPCHYDKTLGYRATNRHTETCPRDHTCPAKGRGCEPCEHDHCAICGREHATTANPQTCPECLAKIRTDFDDIGSCTALLAVEALEAGADGRLAAAAPIPGGDAQVLNGPVVIHPGTITYNRHLFDDHRPTDPVPPLAVLGQWEDVYRAWLDHTPGRRATVAGAIRYLTDQLPYIAQRTDGPDFLAFTRQIRDLRSQLEHALHDEREPERGVECFECGDQLVRRFRKARRCTHRTPARDRFRRVAVELGYPEHLTALEVRQARKPCGNCDQGGIDDPTAGLSWECPGCRKEYKPGEYANAVRRDLLDNGATGDGWTHVRMAADAASTLVGVQVSEERLRKWADRGKVASCCAWSEGVAWGQRLVYWPDVADEANAAVERAQRAAEAKRRRAEKKAAEAAEKEAAEAAATAAVETAEKESA